MNRAQRREADKEARKNSAQGYRSCIIPSDLARTLPDGTKFTINGLRILSTGQIVRNCKAGEETVFTATQPVERLRPAIRP